MMFCQAMVLMHCSGVRLTLIAALLGASLLSNAASAMTEDPMDVVCPVDEKTFTVELMSSYTQLGMRLDLMPLGDVDAPAAVPVCPGSGFVMTKMTYSNEEKALIRQFVSAADFKSARTTYNDYYVAALQLAVLGGSTHERAWLYHQAGWKAEQSGPSGAEHLTYYRALALRWFDLFLAEQKVQNNQWWDAQIVAANLERKLGRFERVLARIKTLPIAALPKDSRFRMLAKQTRHWASVRNADAQKADHSGP